LPLAVIADGLHWCGCCRRKARDDAADAQERLLIQARREQVLRVAPAVGAKSNAPVAVRARELLCCCLQGWKPAWTRPHFRQAVEGAGGLARVLSGRAVASLDRVGHLPRRDLLVAIVATDLEVSQWQSDLACVDADRRQHSAVARRAPSPSPLCAFTLQIAPCAILSFPKCIACFVMTHYHLGHKTPSRCSATSPA
jgi:hypothetical protein